MQKRGIVNPEMILYALERAGKSIGSDEICGLFPFIDRWGTSINPDLMQLERFSDLVSCPIGYFFLSEPPKEDMPPNLHINRRSDTSLDKC